MKIILVAAMTIPYLVIGRTTKPCTCAERMPGDPHAHWDYSGTYVEDCNELPWPPRTYSEDMKRFREMTTGHAVVYGRKTFESFPGQKALPNRRNVIVSPSMWETDGVNDAFIVRTLGQAVDLLRDSGVEKRFLIGGVRIFEEGMKLADELELTLIDRDWPGDAKFPGWIETTKEMWLQDISDNSLPKWDCYRADRSEVDKDLVFTSWRRK